MALWGQEALQRALHPFYDSTPPPLGKALKLSFRCVISEGGRMSQRRRHLLLRPSANLCG